MCNLALYRVSPPKQSKDPNLSCKTDLESFIVLETTNLHPKTKRIRKLHLVQNLMGLGFSIASQKAIHEGSLFGTSHWNTLEMAVNPNRKSIYIEADSMVKRFTCTYEFNSDNSEVWKRKKQNWFNFLFLVLLGPTLKMTHNTFIKWI